MPEMHTNSALNYQVKLHEEFAGADTEEKQNLNQAMLMENINAISQSDETIIFFQADKIRDRQQHNSKNWRGWCSYYLSKSAQLFTRKREKEHRRINFFEKECFAEEAFILQHGARKYEIKLPELKLKGWLGWLLGTAAFIGTGATGVYLYGRGRNNVESGKWLTSPTPLGMGETLMPGRDTEVIEALLAKGAYAEKLQMNPESNNNYTIMGGTEEYNNEALLDVGRLRDYARLKYDKRIPVSLRYLEQTGQVSRDFYNRYLYPMLKDAADNLNLRAIPVNGKRLMAELISIISSTIQRLEELNIAHALRIDPLYDKLMYLNREIRQQENINEAPSSRTQMVYAKWLAMKLKETTSVSELSELQQEALTLIKYYSRSNNLNANYHFSNRLKEINDKVSHSLYQIINKLTYKGVDKYLTDYFAAWLLNLDKEVCQDIRGSELSSEECKLFEGIGISLFKYKLHEYIKPASLLIANKLFIPRLKQIMNSSHLRIDSSEHRFIEILLCAFTQQQDVFFCSEHNAAKFPGSGKDILFPFNGNNNGKSITTEEIEEYVAKPVPFDGEITNILLGASAGIGAATGGIIGTAGISIAISQNEKALKTMEHLDLSDSDNFNPNNLPDTKGNSHSDSSLNSDSSAQSPERRRDLERFPDIPFPQLEHRDQMMVWNTRARDELQGKDYIVTKGITADISGEVPEYITQAQIRLQAGFSEVEEMVKNLRENLRIKLDGKKPDNDYQNYLREFFSKAVNTEDPKIIGMCINRFREAVNAVDEFFKKTREQHYSNIFIISTRQQESAVKGQFTSLLSTEELDSVPVAMTSRSSNPTIAVVYDHSVANDPMHEELSRQGLNYYIPETLGHEAAHAALDARDYFYLPRTAEGRAISPKEAYQKIRASLEEMKIQRDLKEAIKEFTAQRKLTNPFGSDSSLSSGGSVDAGEIMKLLDQYPAFRSYLIMNNAEHLLIYMQYISRGAPFDAAPLQ